MNLRPLCICICCNRYVSKQLIYFWKLNCSISNLQIMPIRIDFRHRAGKLQIYLFINPIVNYCDDLSFVQPKQFFIDLSNGIF